MAKRKRLTLPDNNLLGADEPPSLNPIGYEPLARVRHAPIADVAGDAAMMAALEDVTQTLSQARANGRLVLELPLETIEAAYLVRDRVGFDPIEMTALVESLRARGQQNPIEVVDLGAGRYGLISGWRRLMALRQLRDEDSLKFGSILALLRKPAEASDAYLAMVEENEIRVGLSYFERARIAAKAVEHGVYSSEKAALLTLYHAASRAKRSKIRSFLAVVQALDGHLQFPSALGERLGLVLAKAIEDDSDITQRLRVALQQADITSAEEEQAVLQAALVSRGEAEGRGIKTVTKSPLDTISSDSKIVVTEQDDGSLTLSGGGVTRALRPALEAWLQGWNKS